MPTQRYRMPPTTVGHRRRIGRRTGIATATMFTLSALLVTAAEFPSAASASSPGYTTVSSDCGGTTIQVNQPDPGQGMPASLFPGVASSVAAKLESASMTWIVPSCTAMPAGDAADPVPAQESGTYAGRIPFVNWSGYQVSPESGNNYIEAGADWVVPPVTSSTGDNQYSSTWVGLGSGSGKNSSGQQYLLDQAGTNQNVVSGKAQYYFFWEFAPLNLEQLKQPNGDSLPLVSANNEVYVDVFTSGSDQGNFVLTNFTTNVSIDFHSTWGSGYTEGGGQAEWIMERQEVDINGVYDFPELADYKTMAFQDMYVTNENDDVYYPGELNRQQDVMTNCIDTATLSSPSNLVNGSSQDNSGTITWEASGSGESVADCRAG
jgi:hypothetical protein